MVGILITIGWLTRSALIVTLCLMIVLMDGITLLQDWTTAASQLIYNLILFVLLAGLGFDIYSMDYQLSKKGKTNEAKTNTENLNLFKLLFDSKKMSRRSRPKPQNTV